MSEDARRGRPRVGDETQARIDDIAEGWGKKGNNKPAVSPDNSAKLRTRPPPPPGSAARPDPGASGRTPLPAPSRSKPTSAPPPIPAARTRKTNPPPPPKPKSKNGAATRPPRPPPGPPPPPKPKTPVIAASEPAGGPETLPEIKPEPEPQPEAPELAEAFEPEPEASGPGAKTPAPKPPPAAFTTPDVDGSAAIRRPDPVLDAFTEEDDAATVVPTGEESEARRLELRTPAALARTPGIAGDLRYVFTVFFGLRRIRVDLADTEAEIEAEKRLRDKELAELARVAIADDSIATPVIERARERLVELEEVRAKKAGAAAAVEEAISTLKRERDKVATAREERIGDRESTIAELTGEIEPLEKERARLNKEIREFKDTLDGYDRRIEAEEEKLSSDDTAEVVEAEAAIASLRAERETAAAEEPELADKLERLEAQIKELKARRGELQKEVSKLRRAEDESVIRSEERIAAAQAHKLVVDRAANDMSREQNELLTELGQKLYDKPPPSIARLALPLKERMITLARLKDRAIALAEERASVERGPLFRGVALWVLIAAAIGAGVFFALS